MEAIEDRWGVFMKRWKMKETRIEPCNEFQVRAHGRDESRIRTAGASFHPALTRRHRLNENLSLAAGRLPEATADQWRPRVHRKTDLPHLLDSTC
eukprot:767294-Hanusia_phi.AAC.4